jgi:hypothetical protein
MVISNAEVTVSVRRNYPDASRSNGVIYAIVIGSVMLTIKRKKTYFDKRAEQQIVVFFCLIINNPPSTNPDLMICSI